MRSDGGSGGVADGGALTEEKKLCIELSIIRCGSAIKAVISKS